MNETLTVPDGLGGLSSHMLSKAIEHLDRSLRDADEETRKAIEIVKLVSRVPRRSPWYGVPMDPEDNSVTVGVVLKNVITALETNAWRIERGEIADSVGESLLAEAARLEKYVTVGRRAYDDYLRHLGDPVRYAEEEAERLRDQEAREAMVRYLSSAGPRD
jgi:hypothetical protein